MDFLLLIHFFYFLPIFFSKAPSIYFYPLICTYFC
uniref:Nucleoporin n=1 Tax=Homo sapiens TaxID=9606 RepID=Q8IWV4_HUMAN|nr:nucleoporin [Homo sapiens]